MFRLRLAVTGTFALFLAAGFLMGQDKASSDEPTPSAKAKGALPANFKQLGLTDEQRQKVIKIHASYKSKISALREQIEQLTGEERAELNKVLSETQRIKLRELRLHEPDTSKDMPAKDDKKKDDK
jgi:Spy/CpxP family protein refolding chaperone